MNGINGINGIKGIARLVIPVVVFTMTVVGWSLGHWSGAVLGLATGLAAAVLPWRGQPLYAWVAHYLKRNRRLLLAEPITVANDRCGGGVRYQDGLAVAAIQVLGKRHRPTLFTGSSGSQTSNVLDVAALLPMLRQSMGLTVESVSVVIAGARRRSTGDYPRVYDTLLGTAPYSGYRETWLVVRIPALANGTALRWRNTVGCAALAAAQRIASALRHDGVRARVATAADIVELERRLGVSALETHNRRWHALRGDGGWMATYAYRPADLSPEVLDQAWSLRADGIVQNITIFPGGTACASVTVRTPQPPTAVPSVVLRSMPGEQARGLANSLCGPWAQPCGQGAGPLPAVMPVPVGPSGVLIGKLDNGDRLLLPLGDPGEHSRVRIAADDAIAKRVVIRAAAAGERITVHSRDIDRWISVRMPNVAVTDQPRQAPGTTLSVTDGTVVPASRANTVIEVGETAGARRGNADIAIVQTGPATVEVHAAGSIQRVEVEFFRAENRYLSDTAPQLSESALT